MNYNDANHVHAATHIGATQKYWYDENGNQITRIYGADTYTQIYDAENRMVEVKKGGVTVAQFTYNGDGQRVKSVINGETIQFVNAYYERKSVAGVNEITKHYFAGSQRIAVRKTIVPQSDTLNYFLGDHLGSTSVVMDDAGTFVSETRYKPWGEVRYTTASKTLPTRYTFTGQYSHMDDSATDLGAAGFGLMFYNARWYDPALGRMIQADTVVPGGVQGLDRYAYVGNSPVRYTDPSGHESVCGYSYSDPECSGTSQPLLKFVHEKGQTFTDEEKQELEARAQEVADAFARELNQECIRKESHLSEFESAGCSYVTPEEAFYGVFGGSIWVKRVNDTCVDRKRGTECYGQHMGPNLNGQYVIYIFSNATSQEVIDSSRFIVHEIGHAFIWASTNGRSLPPGNTLLTLDGLASGYQYHSSGAPQEVFADMFVGWVYGKWEVEWGTTDLTENGQAKFDYMNENMPKMIEYAIGR